MIRQWAMPNKPTPALSASPGIRHSKSEAISSKMIPQVINSGHSGKSGGVITEPCGAVHRSKVTRHLAEGERVSATCSV